QQSAGLTATVSGTNAGTYVNAPTGTDGNYNLTFVNGALTINKAALTVTGNSSTVTYNGGTQSVAGFTVSGLVGGETASVLTGVTASGASAKNAGTYANTVTGTDANYTLTLVNGALTINKANATVTGNSATVTYNGQTQSVSGFTVTGLVNGETATVLTGVSASGSGKNAGSYANAVSGVDSNYNLTLVDGALTINKANATVTANSATLNYNGTLQTVTGFTVTGLVNGETASVLTGVSAYGAGTSPGTYATKASGTAQNYALAFVDGVLLINQSTDFGAIKHDEIIKTTTVPVIQELVLPVICEASVSNYTNLGRQSCAVPSQ
ncbi:MAG: MBG domain-containing protein, partial [Hyphomicrobiales bacterium]|nr:MBG domain-containing protein [Hyphomicrobiales bacterium]